MTSVETELDLLETGDTIKITTKQGTTTCILLPRSTFLDDTSIVVKLPSGYNKAIRKEDIISLKRLASADERPDPAPAQKITQAEHLPRVSILHTGGTIASKVDYTTGGVIARFTPQDLLDLFPEIKQYAHIDSKLISNMFSDDMRFTHYNTIAKAIEAEIQNGAQAVVITHGTDTLHYTAAALSFILKNTPVPVLLVGAQRSSDRASSDAAYNLINAVYFLTQTDYCGVGICMHETEDDSSCLILSGTHARKMHSSRRDAFQPTNVPPIASVNFKEEQITPLTHDYPRISDQKGPFELHLMDIHCKVGMLYIHPHMNADEFKHYENYDGVILIGTGLGHAPITENDSFTEEHTHIKHALTELARNTIVAMASQTIEGRIDMNVYSPGRELQKSGIIGNLTMMTPEVAFIKLAWLLSTYTSRDEIISLYHENLCGENPLRSAWRTRSQ